MDERHSSLPLTLDHLSARLLRLEREITEMRQLLCTYLALAPLEGAALPDGAVPVPDPPPVTSDWSVTCLGTFALSCYGRVPPPCRSRRGQAVLKYLLTRPGHAASVDTLIECFWPELDAAAGAHNLQMAVYALRRTLRGCGPGGDDAAILFLDGHYRINPALVVVSDVARFRESYARGQRAVQAQHWSEARDAFEVARTLYGGDFLADSPYDEWTAGERAALLDMHLTLLAHLANVYTEARAWDAAADCCRAVLASDGYREDACRQLMRCYAALGRPTDVRRAYHTCAERLRCDLHLDPAPETRALYERLIAARPIERALSAR